MLTVTSASEVMQVQVPAWCADLDSSRYRPSSVTAGQSIFRGEDPPFRLPQLTAQQPPLYILPNTFSLFSW